MGPSAYRISTDAVTETERFEFWRETAETTRGLTEEWAQTSDPGFSANGQFDIRAGLFLSCGASSSTTSRRRERGIADFPSGGYLIYRELGDGCTYDNGRQTLSLRRNDLMVVDYDSPGAMHSRAGFRTQMLLLPKAMLEPHLTTRARPLAVKLTGRPGLQALAASYFQSFVDQWDAIGANRIGAAADTLGRLIGVACGGAHEEHLEAVADARLVEAKRHVDAHLADPALSVATAALALKLSERSLYALFERQGTSFAAHVRQRRLEECRAALIAQPTRPVIDIAFAWGFGSMPSFYRAFQAAFGLSPSDLREAARSGALLPPFARNEVRTGEK